MSKVFTADSFFTFQHSFNIASTYFRFTNLTISSLMGEVESQKGPYLRKVCHACTTIMKLCTVIPCLKKTQNLCDTPLEFCWLQHFFTKISNFCCIKKCRNRWHFNTLFLNFSTLLDSLKLTLIRLQFWRCQQNWLFQTFLKQRYFKINFKMSQILSMTWPTKFYNLYCRSGHATNVWLL